MTEFRTRITGRKLECIGIVSNAHAPNSVKTPHQKRYFRANWIIRGLEIVEEITPNEGTD
jgi:hypothetical protein